MSSRAGFTLVEVLLALTLGLAAIELAYRIANQALWIERSRGERAGLTASLRTAAIFLERELESLGADTVGGSDLGSLVGGATFRAQRGLRVSCRIVPDTVVVVADTALDWTARQPQGGRDSVLLYLPGTASGADGWLALPLAATRSDRCPGGAVGLALVTTLDSSALAIWHPPQVTAVRLFEVVAVRAYSGATGGQLGLTELSAGAVIQPLAGGISPGGLSFSAFDRFGAPVGPGASAREIQVAVAGQTERPLAAGMGARSALTTDSTRVQVVLRNVP